LTFNKISISSIVDDASQLQIQNLLATRYPATFKWQASCWFNSSETKWCGGCSKCVRVYFMLKGLGLPTSEFFGDLTFPTVTFLRGCAKSVSIQENVLNLPIVSESLTACKISLASKAFILKDFEREREVFKNQWKKISLKNYMENFVLKISSSESSSPQVLKIFNESLIRLGGKI